MKKLKLASALNLVGLATALTACYVLWTQVEFARNYNHCITEYANLYRMEGTGIPGSKPIACICRPIGEELRKMPEVESVFIGSINDGSTVVKIGDKVFNPATSKCTADGIRAFRPTMVAGVDTLTDLNSIIIPRSLAQQMFGRIDVVGEMANMGNMDKRIVGVYEDFPANCLVPNTIFYNMGNENIDEGSNWIYHTFVRCVPGTTEKALNDKAFEVLVDLSGGKDASPEKRKELIEELHDMHICLRPVSETYFTGIDPADKGNRGMMLVLEIACIVLIVVAAINFANFTLAETPMRIKGVNTCKVLGMTNLQLRLRMIGETLLTALTALGLSVLSIHLLSLWPWIQSLIVGSLAIADNLHLMIYIVIAAVVIGLLVGVYPAFYATSFQPAMVLKGSFGLSPRGQMLRKALVSLQLFFAFTMAIYLGVLRSQSHYIFHADYGFDKDEVLYCKSWVYRDRFESVRSELEKIPGVESVAYSLTVPGVSDLIMSWGRSAGDQQLSFTCIPCDWKFFRTMGIDIVEGRDFAEKDEDVFIVNQTLRDAHDWIRVDQPMYGNAEKIVGICKNHQTHTMRTDNSSIETAYIIFGSNYSNWQNRYNVIARVGKNIDKLAVKHSLEKSLDKIAPAEGMEPKFMFMDERIQTTYEEEFRFIRQVEIFSVICLLITLVGVFCLTMFETEYRRKEIGLRKILGNRTRDIILMFCRRYASLIAIAFVFAAPLSYYMAVQWLQNFAERTPVHWWLWFAGLAAVSLIVLLTVAVQTWRTARENPVNSIKSE